MPYVRLVVATLLGLLLLVGTKLVSDYLTAALLTHSSSLENAVAASRVTYLPGATAFVGGALAVSWWSYERLPTRSPFLKGLILGGAVLLLRGTLSTNTFMALQFEPISTAQLVLHLQSLSVLAICVVCTIAISPSFATLESKAGSDAPAT